MADRARERLRDIVQGALGCNRVDDVTDDEPGRAEPYSCCDEHDDEWPCAVAEKVVDALLAASAPVPDADGEEPHCSTCVCGRRAPVQKDRKYNKPAGSIAWWEHEKAWEAYGARYSQSAKRIAERGGFGYGELVMFLGHEPTTWSVRGRSE